MEEESKSERGNRLDKNERKTAEGKVGSELKLVRKFQADEIEHSAAEMWGFISTARRKIEALRKEMCDSQGKMGKTTHTIAAALLTSIKEQLKGYVKGKRGGSKQGHKQQNKANQMK